MLFFQDQAPSLSNPSMEDNPIAETREAGPQALLEEVQESSRKILTACRETLEIKSEISIISKKCLDPSAKNSLRISRPHLNPSLVWMFTM
jgi:hypothetical protein